MSKKTISIIIPCFQEENNLLFLKEELIGLHNKIGGSYNLQVIVVDDGSRDNSLVQLKKMKKDVSFEMLVIKLSGNFGSYSAFLAGLEFANGDCCFQVHCDLQDPPGYIPEMLAKWEEGYKYVIGERRQRNENVGYLILARLYHKIIKNIALPFIPEGGYDLVLIDKKIRDQLLTIDSSNTNLMYLISSMKYTFATVAIERNERKSGQSGYNLAKRYKLIIDSITSLSYIPIKLVSYGAFINLMIWLFVCVLGLVSTYINFSLFEWLIYSLLSFMLLSLSIIAEYLWRTYHASAKRPQYYIDEVF